ncbi:MAG TPA: hypothetical protein VFB35_03150 [Gaiellaceae bacterium]|nr:hypothetical protein [Gaiellaceae bacterium]
MAATLALLFSLAGTGTAATLTVGRLTGKDIRDGSLTLRDLSPGSVRTLSAATDGGGGASSLRLAGYVKTSARTLADTPSFQTNWSMGQFKVSKGQLFILTGNFGSASTPGCASGDFTYSERILLDGEVLYEHDSDGTTVGTPPNFALTFTPGKHTLSDELRGDCPGFPVSVPDQQIIMIPFTLPKS